jgi:hypothetical protein
MVPKHEEGAKKVRGSGYLRRTGAEYSTRIGFERHIGAGSMPYLAEKF